MSAAPAAWKRDRETGTAPHRDRERRFVLRRKTGYSAESQTFFVDRHDRRSRDPRCILISVIRSKAIALRPLECEILPEWVGCEEFGLILQRPSANCPRNSRFLPVTHAPDSSLTG